MEQCQLATFACLLVHLQASSHQQSGAHRPRATTEVARRPPQQAQQQHRQQQHVSVDVRSEAAAAAARAKDLTAAAARAAALADPNDKELLRDESMGRVIHTIRNKSIV